MKTYTINDVESVSYDFEKEVMVVELKNSVVYNKRNRKKVTYKVSYEAFVDASSRFVKTKG